MSEREGPRELVLDTSVAVKFHVPEEQHEEARALRAAFEEGRVELLAPGTILPEAFNAFWQLHRRGELSREEVREGWDLISDLPLALYAPEDLMPRAAELTFETGVIIYDASSSPSPRTPRRSSSLLTVSSSKPWRARPTFASRTPCPMSAASSRAQDEVYGRTATGVRCALARAGVSQDIHAT